MIKSQNLVGNQNGAVHGGEGAIKRLSTGDLLQGAALEFEEAANAEVNDTGIVQAMRTRAIRHMAVADLFYAAINGCDDIEELDKLVKRYGWLNASASRQLMQVYELEKARSQDGILDLALNE